MSTEHFPHTSKPPDPSLRAFHRINAPHYDVAVDSSANRRGNKRPPSGLAKESGARGPEAFKDSGFLEHFAKLAAKLLKAGLLAVPILGGVLAAVDEALKKLTGTSPIEELFSALGRLASSSVEGALFAKILRSIPAWVPVGRRGYKAEFRYEEDGTPRTTSKEEEREVEGFLTASYMIQNDVVFTQWAKYRHWAFHVLPTPGYRYLIGAGNIPDPNEEEFLKKDSFSNDQEFTEVLRIYGQQRPGGDADRGALECLMDLGAIGKAPGDNGFHGVHFASVWPHWPMAGDYFWAAGRWSYDCARAVARGKTELYPTQINPIKAFATSRAEGVKFPDNAASVPAVRFFFLATSEGGFRDFHTVPGRKGPPSEPHITLRDRDYEFIVDLPPHEEGRSPYQIGATIDFPLNTLVLRPRLLMQIRKAPFTVGNVSPKFVDGLKILDLEPRIEILRPPKPTDRPKQVKITVPLSKLPPGDAQAKELVAFEVSFGWHDPAGEEVKNMVRVRASVHFPKVYSQSGPVRLVTGINGRWNLLAQGIDRGESEPPQNPPPTDPRVIHDVVMFLPKDAPVSVVGGGIWFHGFGEFIEGETQATRLLSVGGLLINVDDETKKRLKALLDDARKLVNDLKDVGQDVKEPKEKLRRELKKRIEEEKAKGTDPKVLAELERQLNGLVDGLPDTPDGIKAALAELDKRLAGLLDIFDGIEEFLKVTDDFIGERFVPVWHEDIDNEQKTGVEESKRVSAIARTMFLRPTPVINRHDEPMGWVEFIDETRGNLGREPIGNFIAPDPSQLATAGKLLELVRTQGRNPIRVRMVAPPFTQAGSGNNLARRINPPQKRSDYEFELVLEVHGFPFPAPRSTDPEVN